MKTSRRSLWIALSIAACLMAFTPPATAAAPTLTSISPSFVGQGTTVAVTFTGTNFVSGATVATSNTGIAVSAVTVVSATQIKATFTIDAAAALGAATATVTTSGGTSGAATFTVEPPLTVIVTGGPLDFGNVATGANSSAHTLALRNTSGAALTGITFAFTSPLFHRPAGAAAGTCVATLAAGATCTINMIFSPTDTGLVNATLTITGSMVVTGSPVSLSGTGVPAIAIGNVTGGPLAFGNVLDGTSSASQTLTLHNTGTGPLTGITLGFSAPTYTRSGGTCGATLGAGNTCTIIVVYSPTAPGLASATLTITGSVAVTGSPVSLSGTGIAPPPTLTSITPATGVQGTSVPVTLTGTNFVSGATVAVSDPGIVVSNVGVASATSITATLAIGGTAALGASSITVTTSGGTTSPVAFTVNPPPPTLTSVTPATGVQGTSVPVTLTGTNFVSGATVAVSNPGIGVPNVVVVSVTQITATFSIGATAALGAANVTVTTSGGTTNAVAFTVNPPPPTLTSVTPATGVQGATVPVTLTGSNFVSGATVAVSNPGIGVTNVAVASATQITATFTISPDAAPTVSSVCVNTPGGVDCVGFFVTSLPPTLISAAPSTAFQGDSLRVTLAGTHFTYPATVTSSTPGVSVTNPTVASPNYITATLTIAGDAVPGPGTLTVTTGAGSASTAFAVTARPVITTLSPSTGAANTQVTISGRGFGAAQGTGTVWLGSTPAGSVVSWSDTQIVATVASNAASGNAMVQQSGVWSSAVPFTVNTPTISSVTPASGVPGTTVTIAGSGFGAAQGTGGQVWLGTMSGVVQSWSDTQVVATVALGAASGSARILQNGVMSNAVTFSVNSLHITSVYPAVGVPGSSVTITGTGFGSSQGSGTVLLGSSGGQVVSWSDTQVVAAVAADSLTGIVRVQQNGVQSNAVGFSVALQEGGTVDANVIRPNLLTMSVGDTRALQALTMAGQPAMELMWTSSDATVVGLSTDDPPLLIALAAGHATIRAGTASADVTVLAGALPVGTVLWSNPGNGSGVTGIGPAVPSPSGVADVFAFQADGTVQATTSDGTTAWTAQAGNGVPDFQGGLIVVESSDSGGSIFKLDGIDGHRYPAYSPGDPGGSGPGFAGPYGGLIVHTDGTIFAMDGWGVVGIDPTTGTQKFLVPLPHPYEDFSSLAIVHGMIIAGDGYAYVAYEYAYASNGATACGGWPSRFIVLRVSSSGASDTIPIMDYCNRSGDNPYYNASMITNADTGVLITWRHLEGGQSRYSSGLVVTRGTSASVINVAMVPDQYADITPVLQAQDGSFVGTTWVDETPNMLAFDLAGNVHWTVPGLYQPQIATADGGVIAQALDPDTGEATGAAVTFDQNGNATGMMGNLPTQSWLGYAYQDGPIDQVAFAPAAYAISFAAAQGGSPSGSGTYVQAYDAPQVAMYELGKANLTARPQCDALLKQFATMGQVTEANLIAQLQAVANGARYKVFDGPSSPTWLDPVKFPDIASPGVSTVGQWFAAGPGREGLSQFNGYAVWVDLDEWHSWIRAWLSPMLYSPKPFVGGQKVNYYGMGTVMHEILHKQAVGGGFTHPQMDAAIGAVGWPELELYHNNESVGIGKLCFGNRQ